MWCVGYGKNASKRERIREKKRVKELVQGFLFTDIGTWVRTVGFKALELASS